MGPESGEGAERIQREEGPAEGSRARPGWAEELEELVLGVLEL